MYLRARHGAVHRAVSPQEHLRRTCSCFLCSEQVYGTSELQGNSTRVFRVSMRGRVPSAKAGAPLSQSGRAPAHALLWQAHSWVPQSGLLGAVVKITRLAASSLGSAVDNPRLVVA